MKRIGITQRVTTRLWGQPHDCLDASWLELLSRLSLAPVPLPNIDDNKESIVKYLSESKLSGLVLSGGNDISGLGEIRGSEVSEARDAFEAMCIDWATEQEIPIFAVCRGFQFLNIKMGGRLSKVENHAATRHAVNHAPGSKPDLLDKYPLRLEVNSYHTFAITAGGLAPGFIPLYTDEEGHIEAAYRIDKKVVGVMWHPEREKPAQSFDEGIIRALF